MNNFKIGDAVEVINKGKVCPTYEEFILQYASKYVNLFEHNYLPSNGQTGKIIGSGTHSTYLNIYYAVISNSKVFCIGGEGLKLVKPTHHPTIIIHTDGITTTALLKEGRDIKSKATAVCSPNDTYDHEYGVKLALDRLFGHEVKTEKRMNTGMKMEDKAVCDQIMRLANKRRVDSLSFAAYPQTNIKEIPGFCTVYEISGDKITRSETYHPEAIE